MKVERLTCCDVVCSTTELLNCIEFSRREYILVELDLELLDKVGEKGWISRGISYEEFLSWHC